MTVGFLSVEHLKSQGVTVLGSNVFVSECAKIYNPKNLLLHDNIRIDDFTILSCKGRIEIKNYVHIGSHCLLSCSTNIVFHNFTTISSGVRLFGGTDDYSGYHMTNPMVPEEFTNVTRGDIILEEHVIIGSNSVVLPGVVLKEGTSVGALSMVNKTTDPWKIYAGVPSRILKDRIPVQNRLQSVAVLL